LEIIGVDYSEALIQAVIPIELLRKKVAERLGIDLNEGQKFSKELTEEEALEVFDKYGESSEGYEVIHAEAIPVNFATITITTLDKSIIDLLSEDNLISNKNIAEALKVDIKTVNEAIIKLTDNGMIQIVDNERNLVNFFYKYLKDSKIEEFHTIDDYRTIRELMAISKKLNLNHELKFNKIAIAVDFSDSDSKAISKAISLGGINSSYILIHAVESTNALLLGKNSNDFEAHEDLKKLEEYCNQIKNLGYECEAKLGFGKASSVIPEIINTTTCDIIVMASHGHKGLKDLFFGTTLDTVRHAIKVPMLVANE
jgi:nucleotide-binding universal stress UspA family protein/predicted transcriptional regulator